MRAYLCCATCKGRAPFPEICGDKQCVCHATRERKISAKYNYLTHSDPTANAAIGNVMKGQKK